MAPPAEELPLADDDAYYLEPVTLDDDDDDDAYLYEEVEVDEGEEEGEGGADAEDEDLEQAIATIRSKGEDASAVPREEAPPRAAVTRRPEVHQFRCRAPFARFAARPRRARGRRRRSRKTT